MWSQAHYSQGCYCNTHIGWWCCYKRTILDNQLHPHLVAVRFLEVMYSLHISSLHQPQGIAAEADREIEFWPYFNFVVINSVITLICNNQFRKFVAWHPTLHQHDG